MFGFHTLKKCIIITLISVFSQLCSSPVGEVWLTPPLPPELDRYVPWINRRRVHGEIPIEIYTTNMVDVLAVAGTWITDQYSSTPFSVD